MSNLQKKERQTSHSVRYSQDLEAMVLEIHDIEGLFPLYVKVPKIPSIGIRKINLIKRNGRMSGLQMT